MTIKVTWAPSTETDVVSYDLEFAADLISAPWALVANVPNNLVGPNYDSISGKFFYAHTAGIDTTYYRLFAYDSAGNKSAPSTPFRAPASTPAIPNNVKVDHNYPTPANLRYQTAGGLPIEGAVVRVFYKADFDLGNTATALATTLTDVRGEWVQPIFLTTGFTYAIQFAKEGLYGPDSREVVV